MRRRIGPLILCLGVLIPLSAAQPVYAHRLVADYSVLPGHRVQVESWFDPTGNNARDAKVEVLRADETVLAQGVMNNQGVFAFAYDVPQSLKVIVSAGEGHRAEVTIPASELAGSTANDSKAKSPATASGSLPAGVPRLSHKPRETWNDILTGIGFLLAMAAFVLSVRNSRKLQRLQARESNRQVPEEITE
jgi:hypothetical protein